MRLKVVSATKTLYEIDDVDALSVVTALGRIQVLPGHINLVSVLEMGEVHFDRQSKSESFLINGGFMVLRNDEIMILSEEAERSDSLSRTEIENAIDAAQKKLNTNISASELIQLERQLKYNKFIRDKIDH